MNPELKKPGEEYSDWKASETSGATENPASATDKQPEFQAAKETKFNTNDLITSDTYIGRITELLKANNIRFEVKEISKAEPVLDDQGKELYTIPGEFVVTIFDAEEATKPASLEYTEEIFDLIRTQDWPIRYGNRGK